MKCCACRPLEKVRRTVPVVGHNCSTGRCCIPSATVIDCDERRMGGGAGAGIVVVLAGTVHGKGDEPFGVFIAAVGGASFPGLQDSVEERDIPFGCC